MLSISAVHGEQDASQPPDSISPNTYDVDDNDVQDASQASQTDFDH
jgi:hypothetical protein